MGCEIVLLDPGAVPSMPLSFVELTGLDLSRAVVEGNRPRSDEADRVESAFLAE